MRSAISSLVTAAFLASTAVYALPQGAGTEVQEATPPPHSNPLCPIQNDLYAHGDDTSDLILGNVIWSFTRSDSCTMSSFDANNRVTDMLAESATHDCSQALPHDYQSEDGQTPLFHLTISDGAPDLAYGDFQKILARIGVGIAPMNGEPAACRTGTASLLNAPDGQAQPIVGGFTFG